MCDAAEDASEPQSARGLPPLPHTTPHTLRRAYISIALLANRFDVLRVMGQRGCVVESALLALAARPDGCR